MKKYFIMLLIGIFTTSIFFISISCKGEVTPTGEEAEEAVIEEEAPAEEAPAEEAPAEGKIKIGEIIYDMSHPYQQAHAELAQLYADKLGIEIIILDGKSSPEVEATAMEDLIAQGVDGIIVQPADNKAIAVPVMEAQDAGIPVVSFNAVPEGTETPTLFLKEYDSAFEMGATIAEKWMELYPDIKISVACIDQPEFEYVHTQRSQAFLDGVMSVAPEAVFIGFLDGQGLRDPAFTIAEDLLQSNPEVNIIYGINADSGLGALGAFQAAGRGKAIDGVPQTDIFAATDGSLEEAIQIADPSSSFKMTMALQPKTNAESLIDLLMKIINGEIDIHSMDDHVYITDFILNGWTMSTDDLEAFLKDQYFIEADLEAEIAK